jgi:hypothetical protein
LSSTPHSARVAPAIITSDGASGTGVWAVTANGLAHSTDDARTFAPVPDAPSLVMIAGATRALWGVDDKGYTWHSPDGAAWQRGSYVGSADAIVAVDDSTAYAATDTALRKMS